MTADHAAQEELSFLIRTVPSVLELHQIGLLHKRFMDYTIGRELHPAPKTIQFYLHVHDTTW